MPSTWGVSWGDAWGVSWDINTTPAPTPAPAPVGGIPYPRRFPVPARLARQLLDEDELLMEIARRLARAGLLTGSSNGKH